MSILIEGMEMPTEEEISKCIIVRHDGEVWIVEFDNLIDGGYVCCYHTNPMRAVPVPPHGRTIDADALFDFILNIYKTAQGDARKAYRDVLDTIVAAGDVIPAEEGEK